MGGMYFNSVEPGCDDEFGVRDVRVDDPVDLVVGQLVRMLGGPFAVQGGVPGSV
jgi:hypothetical protein